MTTRGGDPQEPILVGRVLRAHGVRGEVLVEPLSDNPDRFEAGVGLGLRLPQREGTGAETTPVEITDVRPHRGALLVRFAGVADRDAAEALRGAELSVPAEEVPAAPAGTYYHFDLLGCRVRDAAAGELGEVVDLVEDGGGLLLIVEGPVPDGSGEGEAGGGRRRLPVPFVAAFLRRVDVEEGEIDLELPAGLLETCASRW